MVDTYFKSEQNQFFHLDTETILSPPLYILLDVHHFLSHTHMLVIADTHLDTEKYFNETISIPP